MEYRQRYRIGKKLFLKTHDNIVNTKCPAPTWVDYPITIETNHVADGSRPYVGGLS